MHHLLLADPFTRLVARAHATRVYRRFLAATRRASAVQEEMLLQKVRRNADSDFGREHGFSRIRCYRDFVRQVPILTYADLQPYVDRVKAGRVAALFGDGQRVRMFAMTSGSVEQPKYVPVTDAFLREYRRGWNAFGIKALMDHPQGFFRPILQMTSPMDEQRSPSGVPCGSISGLLAATQKRVVRRHYVVPADVAYIADPTARYYTVMRLAVTEDVAWMVTASPATQLKLARTAAQFTENLIRDVRDGALSDEFDVPRWIRDRLAPRLLPRPEIARRLRGCADRDGRLLPKSLWNLSFVANWTGGTMGLHLHDFPEYFGNTPVRDLGLLASEGRMSIPVEDGTPAGILEITGNFFEFIPTADYGRPHPTVLRAEALEVGQEYYILLTTSAGFYRYDIGDVVRVVGYENQAPIIEFLHKGRHVCSLSGEKLTEQQAVLAFERARRGIEVRTDLFVLAPHWDEPPHYRLHVERSPQTAAATATLADRMDKALSAVNLEYLSKRKSGRLGPVRVNLVPEGFLAEIDLCESSRVRIGNEQFKHRYLFTTPGEDEDFPSATEQPVQRVTPIAQR